jgi:branched-chain amino acid transport system ATP-binding protein
MPKELMLKGEKITKSFGRLVAVNAVDFHLVEGEIAALIGPNGSGKTTLLNSISGLNPADSGKLIFQKKNIIDYPANRICKMGIAKTNQIVCPFYNMDVLANVVVGALYGKDRGINIRKAEEEALHWLDFVGLSEISDSLAKDITYAELRMLEVARAISTKPKILLLDEPLAGLNSVETQNASRIIRRIRDELDVTIFWVEHVMRTIMEVSERIIVLNFGEKIAEGTPEEVSKNPDVTEAYLGGI